jgi:hypothetical protein
MKLTLSKFETRRVLNLPTIRDVDALVKTRILAPAAYDPNGRPLFDADAVRRAAAHIIRPKPSPA